MNYAMAFGAGFLSTLVFHQGVLALFYAVGAAKEAPYSRKPTAPFGVPEVISMALWGGAWGIVLWLGLERLGGWWYWAFAIIAGAIGPTLVTFFVVFRVKGRPPSEGGLPVLIAGVLIVNGAWGLGVGILMMLYRHWLLPA